VGRAFVTESGRAVFVRLSDAALADEFVGFLRRADCVADLGAVQAHAEGVGVEVEVPEAYDGDQARMEVALYLRVWEAVYPGSGAEILD
jgi:hypothetical protein